MKIIEVAEMKKLQLDILTSVASFCEKEGVRYYLAGGTLLGAIRHKGFIPWDDDIDICMPRPDYEEFVKKYQSEIYKVFSWKENNNCLCTYAKVFDNRTIIEENGNFGEKLGVNIDIFPVDGLPNDERKINYIIKKMKILWGLVVCATVEDISKRSTIKKIEIAIMRIIYKLFPIKHYVTKVVISTAKKYEFEKAQKVGTIVWGYGKKEVINYATATEYIKMPFEDLEFFVPQNYNEYLTNLYGNYMKYPPKDEQVYKHGASAHWKETI